MIFSRLSLALFFLLTLISFNIFAQTVGEKADISRTGVWVAPPADEEKKDFPIHVTDILLQRPEAQEAMQSYRQRVERLERGYETRSMETASQIGDRKTIKLYNFVETDGNNVVFDDVEMELRAVGDLSEIWVEVDELGTGKISQEVIDGMLSALEEETPERSINADRGIIDINQELFGNPPGVSDKAQVFLADIQDGWDPDEGGGFIAGFFFPLDLSTTNPNSNRGDIIYINTYPGIYTEARPANPQNALSTIAHEYQHLIHARYGNLNLFQNEGQSELAEILTGFNARPMAFLNDPEEIRGNSSGLYRWRRDDVNEVLRDYERAGLLHAYLSERVGPFNAGKLTQASEPGRRGYESVLTPSGIIWEEFLTDFYVANWANDRSIDERFGYAQPQLRSIQVSNPALSFDSATNPSWVFNEEVTIGYGGAGYTNWFGVKNLNLDVNDADGIRHYVASRRQNEQFFSVEPVNGPRDFEGLYESVTLISVNTTAGSSEANPGIRSYNFTANWDRTNLAQKEFTYYSQTGDRFFVELFGDEDATAYSVRFTPDEPGNISNIHFVINNRVQGVSGDGTLQVTLSESQSVRGSGSDEVRIPAETIALRNIPFSDLAQGTNYINVDASSWEVNKDQDYHITLEVNDGSPDAKLEFLIDGGSENENNTDYYPVRTIVYVVDHPVHGTGWLRFGNHNNLFSGINLIFEDDALAELNDSDPPYADTFELEQNYPNPFNPSTTIKYNLVEGAHVRLEVYDVLGRKVATLVDGEQSVGSYQEVFDATGLSSGIYLYRLQAGDFTRIAKMTLTK